MWEHKPLAGAIGVVTANYEILSYPKNALDLIERIARTCYKSENKITSDSAPEFVRNLIDTGHDSMLEFGTIIVKFISNRGFTHQLVRHRLCSFAQESTRYCNYSKFKFNSMIQVVDPSDMLKMKIKDENKRQLINLRIMDAWIAANDAYMQLLSLGATPDVAREVLPIGVKSEITIKTNLREWRYILKLRTSKKSHPRMRELMIPLAKELAKLIPVVFDDLVQNES